MKKISLSVPPGRLGAVDESSVLLVTRLRKVVARRGSRPVLRTANIFKGVTVIGVVFDTGTVIVQIQQFAAEEQSFKQFLYSLKRRKGTGALHLVLDNASYHHRKTVKQLAKKKGIHLHFQPAHSPFLNAAEDIWRLLKEDLRARLFTTLDELEEAIREFFHQHPKLHIRVVNNFS